MNARQIAQAIRQQMSRTARKTRAHEKAQVVDTDANGNAVVSYKGAEISLPNTRDFTLNQWLLVERTDAGLQLGGNSAYGGGA